MRPTLDDVIDYLRSTTETVFFAELDAKGRTMSFEQRQALMALASAYRSLQGDLGSIGISEHGVALKERRDRRDDCGNDSCLVTLDATNVRVSLHVQPTSWLFHSPLGSGYMVKVGVNWSFASEALRAFLVEDDARDVR